MGIYDRDYYRDRGPDGMARGQLQRWRAKDLLRMWSVTTWLIVLCVAVFVIDGFLPPRVVWTGRVYGTDLSTASPSVYEVLSQYTNAQQVQVAKSLPDGQQVLHTIVAVPVIEKSTGQQIGWAEVIPMRFLESYLHFSTRLGFLQFEFWRLVGFQFLHANEYHLLFNMIGLYFFGPLVEQYLGSKRYLAFYLLCGIFGATMYLLLNLSGHIVTTLFGYGVNIPGLLFDDTATPLVGASAGIFGVLMAGAYLAPNAIVYLFFFLPMRLQTVAYGLVAVALGTVVFGGRNAGGEAGHLGGAIAGYYFIRHTHHLHNFFDVLGRMDPTSRRYKHGAGTRERTPIGAAEVDRVLQKISEQGMGSLSDAERETLRRYSRRDSS